MEAPKQGDDLATQLEYARQLQNASIEVHADAFHSGQAPQVIDTPDDCNFLLWLGAEKLHGV